MIQGQSVNYAEVLQAIVNNPYPEKFVVQQCSGIEQLPLVLNQVESMANALSEVTMETYKEIENTNMNISESLPKTL